MTVRFDTNLEDVIAFNKRYVRTDKRIRRMVLVVQIVFSVLWAFLCMNSLRTPEGSVSTAGVVTLVIGLVLWIFLFPRLYYWLVVRMVRKNYTKPENSIYLGPTEMTLGEDDLQVKRTGVEDRLTWDRIMKVEETGDYIFVYISSMAAFVLPKRKVSGRELEEARTILEDKVSCYKRV